jgi:hypothetical protein
MTLCPVAIAVGCQKCAVFRLCPAKSIIGDYKKEADSSSAVSDKSKTSDK